MRCSAHVVYYRCMWHYKKGNQPPKRFGGFSFVTYSGIDSRNLRKRSKVQDCPARVLIRDRADRLAIAANDTVLVKSFRVEEKGKRKLWFGRAKEI